MDYFYNLIYAVIGAAAAVAVISMVGPLPAHTKHKNAIIETFGKQCTDLGPPPAFVPGHEHIQTGFDCNGVIFVIPK